MTCEAEIHLLGVVQYVAVPDARAAAATARPGRIRDEAAIEIHHGAVVLGSLDVLEPDRRNVPVTLRAETVPMHVGAAADMGLVQRLAAVALAVLVAADQHERVRPAIGHGLRLTDVLATGRHHLGQRLGDDRLHQPHGADRSLPDGRRIVGVDDRPLAGDDLEGAENTFVPWQVIGDNRKHSGSDARVEARPGAVQEGGRLVGRGGEVEQDTVMLLGHFQADDIEPVFQPVVIEIGLRAVNAVRQLDKPGAHRRLRELDRAIHHRQNGIDPVLIDGRFEPLLGDSVGCEEAAEVERHVHGRHRIFEHHVQNVVAESAVLHDLHRRDQQALLAYVTRLRAELAANADLMRTHPDPANAFASVEYRRHETDVGRVERALVGVVDHEHVARAEPGLLLAVGNDVLHHLGNRSGVVKHVLAQRHDLAIGAIDAGIEVGRIVDQRRAGNRREGRGLLLADGDQTVAHHLEGDGIHLGAVIGVGFGVRRPSVVHRSALSPEDG